MQLARKLWNDQRGEVQITAALLLCVFIGIGSIVGLATFRDQLIQEFGDVGVALENLDQSYSTDTSIFIDTTPLDDPVGQPPGCLDLSLPASGEN